jgi:hypothetical protein
MAAITVPLNDRVKGAVRLDGSRRRLPDRQARTTVISAVGSGT